MSIHGDLPASPVAVPSGDAYTGPRPSPARVWAKWLIAACAAVVVGNLVALVLTLIERHHLQERLAGNGPSAATFRDTISAINAVSRIAGGFWLALFVLWLGWLFKRRPKERRTSGESAVEPPLHRIMPRTFWAYWALWAVAIIYGISTRSLVHSDMTTQDYIDYRTHLAVGHLFAIVGYTCLIVLVVGATRIQDRREAAA